MGHIAHTEENRVEIWRKDITWKIGGRFEIYLEETGGNGVGCVHLARDRKSGRLCEHDNEISCSI